MSSGRDRSAKKDKQYANVRNYYGDPKKAAAEAKKPLRWHLSVDRPCTRCGTPLHFAQTASGETMPLDLRAHVYAVAHEKNDCHTQTVVVRSTLAFVSHWFTCPKANEYSGKNRKTVRGVEPDLPVAAGGPEGGALLERSVRDAGVPGPAGEGEMAEIVPGPRGGTEGDPGPADGAEGTL